jgi:hypothetical protein
LIRRLLASLLLVASLFPVAVTTVFASNTQPCVDAVANSRHAGTYKDATNWQARGVRATINPIDDTFALCSGLYGNDGVSAWVAIEPGTGNPDHPANGGTGGIIQLGILKCNSGLSTACSVPNQIWAVWAAGGCGFPAAAVRIGSQPIGAGSHTFTIRKESEAQGSDWLLFIDSALVKTIPNTAYQISCWQADDKMAVWSGETWDGGDSYAAAANKLNFDNAQFESEVDGPFFSPNWINGLECPIVEDSSEQNHRCVHDSSGDGFDLWSVNK